MTERTYKDKNNNDWSWEENAEVLEALKQLHQLQNQEQSKRTTDS